MGGADDEGCCSGGLSRDWPVDLGRFGGADCECDG